jgi:hypothetical protein
MACSTLVLCMDCHLLHTILTHASILKKTNHCICNEVKDTTDTRKSASYLFLHVEINNGVRLKTKHYDKRKAITYPKVNTPFISSYISASPADRVYISQLINYIYRECVSSTVNYTIVITIWFTATKISIYQMIFQFWRWCFLSSYNWTDH